MQFLSSRLALGSIVVVVLIAVTLVYAFSIGYFDFGGATAGGGADDILILKGAL